MSKNVAVFIDVANVFYAAKAAGVDIDYVTLLRAAVAGRDFVRAYAYTGLDPENDNQRQFQAFLARNGYKVVTKDIRKYGDGKVKANLDIELVVDMMKTARNLDVAVVVSGDGDFAPAIRAVQEMGVRVEVISFRGNTSSDLIDVADSFTDITQIAKVERGSSRSGRRVAAEADLSMTEVPEKETEGATRRRRRTRDEDRRRPAAAVRAVPVAAAVQAVPVAAGAAGLMVLPGEKLSRAATPSALAEEPEESEALAEIAGEQIEAEAGALEAGGEPGGRRRRRRRGGRGRGRGRGPEAQALPHGVTREEPEGEEEEEFAAEPPRLPVRSTFGSVWDSQLGMPSTPLTASGELEDELAEEEPEIPEYLLAEQRRRGARGRGRGRGRVSAYQQAVDRERFGRSGMGATPALGRREQRDRVTRGPRERSVRQPREPQPGPRVTQGDEPWSEVPPEVEELLRAELARRGGAPTGAPAASTALPARRPAGTALTPGGPVTEAAAPAPERETGAPRPRRRTAAASRRAGIVGDARAAGMTDGMPAADAGEPVVAAAAPGRRGRAARGTAGVKATAAVAPAAELDVPPPAAESLPASPARRGRRAAAGTVEGATVATGAASPEAVSPEAPAPRRRGRAAATSGTASPGGDALAGGEKPRPGARRSRGGASAAPVDAAPGAGGADAGQAEASAPVKRPTRRRKAADTEG